MIEGKSITGFTDVGETILGVDSILKAKNLATVEDVAKKYGAKYLAPVGPWDDYSITDGRLVTGESCFCALHCRKIHRRFKELSHRLIIRISFVLLYRCKEL